MNQRPSSIVLGRNLIFSFIAFHRIFLFFSDDRRFIKDPSSSFLPSWTPPLDNNFVSWTLFEAVITILLIGFISSLSRIYCLQQASANGGAASSTMDLSIIHCIYFVLSAEMMIEAVLIGLKIIPVTSLESSDYLALYLITMISFLEQHLLILQERKNNQDENILAKPSLSPIPSPSSSSTSLSSSSSSFCFSSRINCFYLFSLLFHICFFLSSWSQKISHCLLIFGIIFVNIVAEELLSQLSDAARKIELLTSKIAEEQFHQKEIKHTFANVAHDLKTPLASFMSGVEIIQKEIDECESKMAQQRRSLSSNSQSFTTIESEESSLPELITSVKSTVQNIQNTNRFMLMTINRCLDYTKAQSGLKLIPKYETIDLRECLHLPMDCMRNIQQKIEIEVEHFDEEIGSHIITDGQWLQENLLCLLSNAVKYSDGGKVDISVQLLDVNTKIAKEGSFFLSRENSVSSFKRTDSTSSVPSLGSPYQSLILFEVQDSGIGLSEEAMNSLFHPFKQSQRLAGGTGLGLYSLARRLDALQGKYGVKERRDGKQGSLFWFAFPYRPDEIISVQHSFSLGNPSCGGILGDHEMINERDDVVCFDEDDDEGEENNRREVFRVLLVDDSPSIIKLIRKLLEKQGHQVCIAENGSVCLNLYKESVETGDEQPSSSCFDVIVMDLQMPIMDGLEATRRIRQYEQRLSPSSLHETREVTCHPPRHQLIIGVSANSDEETVEEAINSGVDAFICKPFTMETFNQLVATEIMKLSN